MKNIFLIFVENNGTEGCGCIIGLIASSLIFGFISLFAIEAYPSLFLTELIIVVFLGILMGIISSCYNNVLVSIVSITLSIAIFIVTWRINCEITVHERKEIYNFFASISLIFPSLVGTIIYLISGILTSTIIYKIKE